MYTLTHVADNIRLVRQARDHPQHNLATLLAIHRANISRWETKNNLPRCTSLIKFANICGVSFASMFAEPRFTRDRYSMAAFRAKLALYRKLHNLRQRDLAKYVGIADSLISLYERGHKTPQLDTLVKMGNRLDIDLDWLFRNEEIYGSANPETTSGQPGNLRYPDRRIVEAERTLYYVA